MSDDYGFDTPIDIRAGMSSKYGRIPANYGIEGPDVIAMWVADMDFAAAPPIREALHADLDRGYLGYPGAANNVTDAISGWFERKHGWKVDPRHVRFTNGVVAAVGVTIAAFTEPGEAVIVFPPVYHAFYRHIRDLGRDVRECELSVEEGRHTFDLEAFGATLRGDERILIFCNPHNPGGRIWSPDEVREIAAFCERHDLILVADEIHMDLCFPGTRHVVTALAAPEALPRLVVLTAASKGFNTAGGETGFAIIPDTDLRNTWSEKLGGYGGQPSRLGLIATEAAFRHGDEWSDALRAYLAENFRLWRERIDAIPGVSVMDMNATYLSWVDFRGTGLDDKELGRRVVTEARIAPSPGTAFGSGGAGHLRFNLALPRPTLLDAIGRIEAAFADLQ